MNDFICIYHGNCADGFGAAWVVRHALGDIQFHAATHGDPPPDVTGKRVIMVDFSYKRLVLNEMAQDAKSILILDHHKSAMADLEGLPAPVQDEVYLPLKGVCALFDMERSGAGITWDYFFPGKNRPALINHVEDRDLWRFRLKGTREIQAALFSYPYDFEVWDDLMLDPTHLFQDGQAIERKHHKDVAELVGVTKRLMVIGGYTVPVANVPYTLASDAGHLMADDAPFAACYWDTPDGRTFSLRSVAAGVDVSKIAAKYGGGGHNNAAGFRMPVGWEGDKS